MITEVHVLPVLLFSMFLTSKRVPLMGMASDYILKALQPCCSASDLVTEAWLWARP